MSGKVKLDLTDEEKEYVARELAERLKDVVYSKAYDNARELVERVNGAELRKNDFLAVTFEIRIIANDLLQIVSRFRRLKEKR